MSDDATEERFRRWHLPWKERVCGDVRPFSHGTALCSPRHPGFWEYDCELIFSAGLSKSVSVQRRSR